MVNMNFINIKYSDTICVSGNSVAYYMGILTSSRLSQLDYSKIDLPEEYDDLQYLKENNSVSEKISTAAIKENVKVVHIEHDSLSFSIPLAFLLHNTNIFDLLEDPKYNPYLCNEESHTPKSVSVINSDDDQDLLGELSVELSEDTLTIDERATCNFCKYQSDIDMIPINTEYIICKNCYDQLTTKIQKHLSDETILSIFI